MRMYAFTLWTASAGGAVGREGAREEGECEYQSEGVRFAREEEAKIWRARKLCKSVYTHRRQQTLNISFPDEYGDECPRV